MICNRPLYAIQRWPFGWVVTAPTIGEGVPMDAMEDAKKLFPEDAVIEPGIARHLRFAHNIPAVFCIVTPDNGEMWRAYISRSLEGQPLQEQWWLGTNVGLSSAAIFAVFCNQTLAYDARTYSRGAIPADAGDFGRCRCLLSLFPNWRDRLHEVAEAYPNTKWPAIVAAWGELEASADVTAALGRLQ